MDDDFTLSARRISQRKTLSVDLGDLKDPWLAWCASNQVSPSQALREVLGKVVSPRQPTTPPTGSSARKLATEQRGIVDSRRVRREISLTGSEDDLVSSLAEARGFSVPKWLNALVRHQLTGEPQLGQSEQEAIAESNYQLLAIGRNLNQIAKSLNTSPDDRAAYNVEVIEQLREYIHSHVDKVSQVLESNTERWKLL